MIYGAIMVYVDTSNYAVARIDLACDIAKAHGATIMGVSASTPLVPVVVPSRFGSLTTEIVGSQQESAAADLKCAERIFREVAARHSCRVEWRCSLDNPVHFLVHEARAADLIIVGQKISELSPQHMAEPTEILLHAGRPVLVVPPTIGTSPLGSNAVIGWKDSREARRVVLDALPLLKTSPQVSVVDIASKEQQDTACLQTNDVVVFLARHNIRAEAVVRTDDGRPLAEHLLSIANEKHAGLVVMGGRSHARLHDWTFGGDTRDMLKKSQICLFVSN